MPTDQVIFGRESHFTYQLPQATPNVDQPYTGSLAAGEVLVQQRTGGVLSAAAPINTLPTLVGNSWVITLSSAETLCDELTLIFTPVSNAFTYRALGIIPNKGEDSVFHATTLDTGSAGNTLIIKDAIGLSNLPVDCQVILTHTDGNREMLYVTGYTDGLRELTVQPTPSYSLDEDDHVLILADRYMRQAALSSIDVDVTGDLQNAGLIPFPVSTYYVATTGNDGNDGSVGTPWATINYAITQVKAGDLIIVEDGTYVENVNFNLQFNARVEVRARNYGQAIIAASSGNYSFQFTGARNMHLSGFTIRLTTSGSSQFCRIRGDGVIKCGMHNCIWDRNNDLNFGNAFQNDAAAPINGLEITNNEYDGQDNQNGIRLTGSVGNVTVKGNRFINQQVQCSIIDQWWGEHVFEDNDFAGGMRWYDPIHGPASALPHKVISRRNSCVGPSTAFQFAGTDMIRPGLLSENNTYMSTGSGSGYGMGVLEYVANVVSRNDYCYNSGTAPGAAFMADGFTGPSDNITVENITAIATQGHGLIFSQKATNVKCKDAMVWGGNQGIVVKATNVRIEGGSFTTRTGNAFYIKGGIGVFVLNVSAYKGNYFSDADPAFRIEEQDAGTLDQQTPQNVEVEGSYLYGDTLPTLVVTPPYGDYIVFRDCDIVTSSFGAGNVALINSNAVYMGQADVMAARWIEVCGNNLPRSRYGNRIRVDDTIKPFPSVPSYEFIQFTATVSQFVGILSNIRAPDFEPASLVGREVYISDPANVREYVRRVASAEYQGFQIRVTYDEDLPLVTANGARFSIRMFDTQMTQIQTALNAQTTAINDHTTAETDPLATEANATANTAAIIANDDSNTATILNAIAGISIPTPAQIAAAVLFEDLNPLDQTNLPTFSLGTLILSALVSERDGTDWNVYRTDGTTLHITRQLTLDATLVPVKQVSSTP